VALYLAKDFNRALEVLASFEKTMKDEKQEKLKKKDRTELTLFEARIYEAMGQQQKAIEFITKSKVVANLVAKNEVLARLYNAVGNKDKAVDHLEELLQLNSSNNKYYYEFLKIRGIEKKQSYTDEEEARIQEVLG
jgi:tetratricopeptide (TPR) repeat protein